MEKTTKTYSLPWKQEKDRLPFSSYGKKKTGAAWGNSKPEKAARKKGFKEGYMSKFSAGKGGR